MSEDELQAALSSAVEIIMGKIELARSRERPQTAGVRWANSYATVSQLQRLKNFVRRPEFGMLFEPEEEEEYGCGERFAQIIDCRFLQFWSAVDDSWSEPEFVQAFIKSAMHAIESQSK